MRLRKLFPYLQDSSVHGDIVFGRKKLKVITQPEKEEENSGKKKKKQKKPFTRISYSDGSPKTTAYFKNGYTRFLNWRKEWKVESNQFSDIDTGSIQILDQTEIPDHEIVFGDPRL